MNRYYASITKWIDKVEVCVVEGGGGGVYICHKRNSLSVYFAC